jgi:uncharacterized protein
MGKFFILLALFAVSTTVHAQTQPRTRSIKTSPAVDHHQHLFSPAIAEVQKIAPITASDVVKLLDTAGIKRGVILSYAYSYSRPGREPQNEYDKVREENDWNGAQAALFPKRLVAFCGINPLKDYALAEIDRCSKNPNLKGGLKMHFGNSDVQLEIPEHVEKLKAVFRAANERRMALVIHMRASLSKERPYGPEQARLFIDNLLPLAKDVTVQIAHMAGTGPGYDDPKADSVLEVFVDAIAKRDPRVDNVWFDLTSTAHPDNPRARSALLAKRIRQIGVKRVLYGTDAALGDNLRPREAWTEVTKLDLTDKEIKQIAKNVAPYLR